MTTVDRPSQQISRDARVWIAITIALIVAALVWIGSGTEEIPAPLPVPVQEAPPVETPIPAQSLIDGDVDGDARLECGYDNWRCMPVFDDLPRGVTPE